MIEAFQNFRKKNQLFDNSEIVLLAVSGGIDSMIMLHLFIKCKLNFAIAHCNFCLRDKESDADEAFVLKYAEKHNIKIHTIKFNTKEYAQENKLSIQVAARELRYNWFKQLLNEYNYTKIATAHNVNDVAETFFINLIRGTGIHGLTGSPIINKDIIRPLLFATREEIEDYANKSNLVYRTDSSNSDTKYLRNAIRHNIIPELVKLNPSFLKSVENTTSILKDVQSVFNNQVLEYKNQVFSYRSDQILISIPRLQELKISATLLFEMIEEYGFTSDVAERMINGLLKQPGATYFSKSHSIVKDRDCYILFKKSTSIKETYEISNNDTHIDHPFQLRILHTINDIEFRINKSKSFAYFDKEKLLFPLTLRRWSHGDYFYPFGMNGKKKISDYFTDLKIPRVEKEQIWLLCSGKDIIWVVGFRPDNRFVITKNTRDILQFELIN